MPFPFDSFDDVHRKGYMAQAAKLSFCPDGALITKGIKLEQDDEEYLQKVKYRYLTVSAFSFVTEIDFTPIYYELLL